jgi:PPP family 3-phenylpropionic acid transporter
MTPLRLAFYYGAAFAVIGIHLPFWSVWLSSRGLNAEEIGIVVAIGIGVKVFANPFIAHIADRHGERRRLMIGLAVLSVAAFAMFSLASDFWAILGVTVLFFIVWAPIMPLGESLTMLTSRVEKLDYGRIRLWGSLTFIISSVGVGYLLVGHDQNLILWLILAGIGVTAVAAWFVPDTRVSATPAGRPAILEIAGDRRFLLFVLAATLIQASHGVYYTFGTIHWQQAGYSEDVIGWLWAEGVAAEIILFAFGNRIVNRVGPARLMALAGLAGTLRWIGTGVTDSLGALVIFQALHAFTFAATHLGAIHFMASRIDPRHSATAQSVYSAVVMGLGLGLAAFASGHLYAAYAGRAYLAMAVMASIGGMVAFSLRRRHDDTGVNSKR